jgi:hypothetical protein
MDGVINGAQRFHSMAVEIVSGIMNVGARVAKSVERGVNFRVSLRVRSRVGRGSRHSGCRRCRNRSRCSIGRGMGNRQERNSKNQSRDSHKTRPLLHIVFSLKPRNALKRSSLLHHARAEQMLRLESGAEPVCDFRRSGLAGKHHSQRMVARGRKADPRCENFTCRGRLEKLWRRGVCRTLHHLVVRGTWGRPVPRDIGKGYWMEKEAECQGVVWSGAGGGALREAGDVEGSWAAWASSSYWPGGRSSM